MIRAVVGVGPRAGTSFVMRSLHEAGLPVSWDPEVDALLPEEGNPGGYFETDYHNYKSFDDVILKVWPLAMHLADIEKMVVLERNRANQIASIEKQVARERELLDQLGVTWAPEEFVDRSLEALSPFLSIPHLRVRTEDLDERIEEIISYMRY
jgi:hypothetical protein